MGTIQTSIDLLPATGAMAFCLDGTYYIATGLVLDSYQTLKGCGRNTIFTATTADLDIITATGSSGSEKTGILLADFCIDGDAGGETNDIGIDFYYVDNSVIRNVWSQNNDENNIQLTNCDSNIISGCICLTGDSGIYLETSNYNSIVGNFCHDNAAEGIYLYTGLGNTITGNTYQGNQDGMYLYDSDYNTITGNTCEGNTVYGIEINNSHKNECFGNSCKGNTYDGIIVSAGNGNSISGNSCVENSRYGIYVYGEHNVIATNSCIENDQHGTYIYYADHNIILGNDCVANSQDTDDTYDDIFLSNSDYNTIQSNICRAGGETNKPRYGINVSDAGSNENTVINNDLYDDGFGTGAYNDAGTGTIYMPATGVGISDDQIVQIDDADAADDDYAKFTANGLEGRDATEVVTDILASFADQLTGAHLSQTFGASSARLNNLIVSAISGEAIRVSNATSASPFSAKINGAPTATSVVYDTDTNENMFNGLQPYDGSAYWGKIILHNTTRSNSRKIEAVNITTNTITTESSTDDWANNDDITLQSQTNTYAGYFDIDLSDNVATTMGACLFCVVCYNQSASATALRCIRIHPYEDRNVGKEFECYGAIAGEVGKAQVLIPIIDQKVTVFFKLPTDHYMSVYVMGYVEYADT